MNTLLLALFAGCVAISFVMSGMETGVFALSRLRIRHLVRDGNRSAAMLHGYLERPEDFLWTILVGNTLANVGSVSIAVFWAYQGLRSWPWLLVVVLILTVLLFYATCELLPKMVFRVYPNRLCLALAIPFRLLHLLLRPLVAAVALLARWLLRWTGGRRFTGHLFANRDELRLVMQESDHVFTSDERTMINRVLDLQNLTLRQVLIPMSKVITVSASTTVQELLDLARAHDVNRIPVWVEGSGRRRIGGVVNLRLLLHETVLDPSRTAGELLQSALYMEDEVRLEIALRQMQRTGQRLVVVLGPDKQELGIVGLRDILKVIFGEVRL